MLGLNASLRLAFALALVACGDEEPNEGPTTREDAAVPSIDSGFVRDGGKPGVDASDRARDAEVRDELTVRLKDGVLRGTSSGDTRLFLGIPYAAPPIGALRFAAPQPATPWSSARDATQIGPVCPQPTDALSSPGPKSEDCLFVNVAAPKQATKAPVMVFLHGGGFHIGSGSDYPIETLSKSGDVVVVSVNYRLGPLGFLTHAKLDEALGMPSGNMGLRDQQLALQWVKANIAAFGGDPENVTLFGESAGAISTCMHMFIPSSAGLASKYLLESGTCLFGLLAPGPRERVAGPTSEEFVADVCKDRADVVACLREVPLDVINDWLGKQAKDNLAFAPAGIDPPKNQDWYAYVDGSFVVEPQLALLRKGAFEKKPVVLGSNLHEWALMQHYGFPRATNRLELAFWVSLMHAQGATEILAEYMPTSDEAADLALESIYTDEWFRCPARAMARELAQRDIPAYLYSYEVAPGFHSQELDYVFGGLERNVGLPKDPPRTFTPALIEAVQGYWTRFARTGDPNGVGAPTWPRYGADQHLALADPIATGSKLAEKHCDFWDALWAKP